VKFFVKEYQGIVYKLNHATRHPPGAAHRQTEVKRIALQKKSFNLFAFEGKARSRLLRGSEARSSSRFSQFFKGKGVLFPLSFKMLPVRPSIG